jgi:acyl-CoA synthetase (NDP forming)
MEFRCFGKKTAGWTGLPGKPQRGRCTGKSHPLHLRASGIDLAVLIVPSPVVREVLIDLGKRGSVGHHRSAGFAETGPEGKKRQDELAELAKGLGIRLIGPNCVGVVNTENRFATIEIMEPAMEPGPVAIMAQSGGSGTSSSTISRPQA